MRPPTQPESCFGKLLLPASALLDIRGQLARPIRGWRNLGDRRRRHDENLHGCCVLLLPFPALSHPHRGLRRLLILNLQQEALCNISNPLDPLPLCPSPSYLEVHWTMRHCATCSPLKLALHRLRWGNISSPPPQTKSWTRLVC